jgi:hypothetical protein
MTNAEAMATATVAMLYFKGNFRLASQYMCEKRCIPNMRSRSRFKRRLHRMADRFLTLFFRVALFVLAGSIKFLLVGRNLG